MPEHVRHDGNRFRDRRSLNMDADYFLTVAHQAMWVLALASAPILIPALVAGLVLGMIQAATSINEQTLSFVPKLIVVAIALVIFGGMIMGLLTDFTVSIFDRIPDLVR
jgi:flagellar biosynthetic protein FliQ